MHYVEVNTPTGSERVRLRGGVTVVGRHEAADIRVVDHTLSRRHAALEVVGREVFVRDLDSKNGTQVNGVDLSGPVCLAIGDVVQIGDTSLVYFQDDTHTTSGMRQTLARRSPAKPRITLAEAASDWASGEEDKRLRVLLQVTHALAAPTQERPFDRVLELCAEIFDADHLALLMVEGGALIPVATHQVRGTADDRPWSQQIVRVALGGGKAVRFDDALRDTRLQDSGSVVRLQVRSALAAPLVFDDQVQGVLYVDNISAPHSFSDSDVDLLGAFANQAAVALHNEHLRGELERHALLQHQMSRFFAPQIVDRMLESALVEVQPVELDVTVLFSDIVGFTARSARAAPTEVLALLNRYFERMAAVVIEAEGMLEKYIGDALMAVWGAPFAQPDSADRAVRAALEMQASLADLNRELAADGVEPVRMTIGIHCGKVAFGNLGSARYLQYATIGDATNVAARVCDAADPDSIFITAQALGRLSAGTVAVEALPPTRVKGKETPLELFRVAEGPRDGDPS